MVEEELGQQAEALTVHLGLRAVDFVASEVRGLAQLEREAGGGERRRRRAVDPHAGRPPPRQRERGQVPRVRVAPLEVL